MYEGQELNDFLERAASCEKEEKDAHRNYEQEKKVGQAER